MKTTKLATLFLTATLSPASGTTLVANSGVQSNNGQANTAADAGQAVLDARKDVTPSNVGNNGINTSSDGTVLHPGGSSMNNDGMTKDEEHKDTMCKDGRCPDINKKVQTGDGINNNVDTKTDGITQQPCRTASNGRAESSSSNFSLLQVV